MTEVYVAAGLARSADVQSKVMRHTRNSHDLLHQPTLLPRVRLLKFLVVCRGRLQFLRHEVHPALVRRELDVLVLLGRDAFGVLGGASV